MVSLLVLFLVDVHDKKKLPEKSNSQGSSLSQFMVQGCSQLWQESRKHQEPEVVGITLQPQS